MEKIKNTPMVLEGINKPNLPTVVASYPCAVYSKDVFIRNPLLVEYQKYRAFLNMNGDDLLKNDNWNRLFEVLDRLTIDPKYVLDDLSPKESLNSTLTLYARPVSIPRPSEEILLAIERVIYPKDEISIGVDEDGVPFVPHFDNHFEHIILDDDPISIWQALLLHTTANFIGFGWHGCYAERDFISSYEQLRKKRPNLIDWYVMEDRFIDDDMFEDENCDFLLNPEAYYPVIDKENHTIKFLWWSEWGGLSYVTFPFEYNADKKTIKFGYYTEENLIYYNCGICY